MKEFISTLFEFNYVTNIKMLGKIWELKDKTKAVFLFSHLINAQDKWMARIAGDENAVFMDGWKPIYEFSELESEWNRSTSAWKIYLDTVTEKELKTEIEFIGAEQKKYAVTPLDIALQLNFHSIHHRAQIQTFLREQGIQPAFVDYIATKMRIIN